MIPETSSTDGVPVVLPSLFVMVIISMIKDVFEDTKRYLADNKENKSHVKAYYNCCYTNKNWVDIKKTKWMQTSGLEGPATWHGSLS